MLLINLIQLPHAWCMIGQKFATPKVKHWCMPPKNSSFEGWDISKWIAFSSPVVDGSRYDHCQIYDVAYDEDLLLKISSKLTFYTTYRFNAYFKFNQNLITLMNNLLTLKVTTYSIHRSTYNYSLPEVLGRNVSLRKCTNWSYDDSMFEDSVVEQFDLVCDKWYYPNLAQTIFFSGVFVGVFCAGLISDRFGRKKAMFGFLCILIGNISHRIRCMHNSYCKM